MPPRADQATDLILAFFRTCRRDQVKIHPKILACFGDDPAQDGAEENPVWLYRQVLYFVQSFSRISSHLRLSKTIKGLLSPIYYLVSMIYSIYYNQWVQTRTKLWHNFSGIGLRGLPNEKRLPTGRWFEVPQRHVVARRRLYVQSFWGCFALCVHFWSLQSDICLSLYISMSLSLSLAQSLSLSLSPGKCQSVTSRNFIFVQGERANSQDQELASLDDDSEELGSWKSSRENQREPVGSAISTYFNVFQQLRAYIIAGPIDSIDPNRKLLLLRFQFIGLTLWGLQSWWTDQARVSEDRIEYPAARQTPRHRSESSLAGSSSESTAKGKGQ